MSKEHSLSDISGLKQSETDIRHIFSRHIKILFNTKCKIADEMTKWSNTLIGKIQEYVAQQRELLEQDYAKKAFNLNALCDQLVKQASIYEEKKDAEHIDELINQCNNLNVQLAALVYVDRPIQTIQLITDEPVKQPTETPADVPRVEVEQPPTKSIERQDPDAVNDSTAKESSPPLTSPTKLPTDETPVINNRNESETNLSHRDNTADKCPICYMIFPQTMTGPDRNLHVNEHYTDD